jgi:hypothetical protein
MMKVRTNTNKARSIYSILYFFARRFDFRKSRWEWGIAGERGIGRDFFLPAMVFNTN